LIDNLFSIVIVNYNGFEYARACVASILESNYAGVEPIVVDNGSTDGSAERLKKAFGDRVTVVPLRENIGPSGARNEGAKVARGEFLGFLDNDTEVHPDWILEAKAVFDEKPDAGILQCKLLLFGERDRIDYAGEWMGPNGFLVHVGSAGTPDDGRFEEAVEILAAKSAGMFMRRTAFDAAGGFDPDYFIMVEETDLGWRNWLAGYKAYLAPRSRVYHHFSTSWSILGPAKALRNARFHGTKNYIMTHIKNAGARFLVWRLPRHVLVWVGFSLFRLLGGHVREFGFIWQGLFWNLVHLPATLEKRRAVQASRKIGDDALFARVMRQESLFKKVLDYLRSFSVLRTLDSFGKREAEGEARAKDNEFYADLHPLHGDSIHTDLSVPLHEAWGLAPCDFAGKRVLEAGCGGMGTQALQLRGYAPASLLVVDFSAGNIASAKEAMKRAYPDAADVDFRQMDLGADMLPADAFDLIHHRGVFQHIKDKDFALRNFRQALAADGLMIIGAYGKGGALAFVSNLLRLPCRFIPMASLKKIMLALRFSPDMVSGILDHLYVEVQTRYTREEFLDLMDRHGFAVYRDATGLTHDIDVSECRNGFFRIWMRRVHPTSKNKIDWLSRLLYGTYGNNYVVRKKR